MKTIIHPARFDARFGITEQHWAALETYAAYHRLFLFIRGGKKASIPWIELGFPGKPMTLKFGVDPNKGLLVARTPDEKKQVLDAGHLLMTKAADGWRATGGSGRTRTIAHPVHDRWAEEGIVIDRDTGLPFTSDYDLSAVIPSSEFDYVRDVLGFRLDGSVTSEWAERVRSDLNGIFGSQRFRHGPQALFDWKLPNKPAEEERIVAFCADGQVFWFLAALTREAAELQYRDLLVAIHPQVMH